MSFGAKFIIAGKFKFVGICNRYPGFCGRLIYGKFSGSPSSFFLLLHAFVESFLIHFNTPFTSHKLRQVNRKTIGIVQLKGFFTGNMIFVGGHLFKKLDALTQGIQEAFFF